MLELSLHILDIAENSIRAKAQTVYIAVMEDPDRDCLTLEIRDDGHGMSQAELERAMDPFYTTKTVRRVGLGLPMLAQAAEKAGGSFNIESEPGAGTRVTVVFQLSHLDRQPLGNLPGTLVTLIAGNPDIHFVYRHQRREQAYTLDTDEVKKDIEDIPIDHIEVLKWIQADVADGLKEISAEA